MEQSFSLSSFGAKRISPQLCCWNGANCSLRQPQGANDPTPRLDESAWPGDDRPAVELLGDSNPKFAVGIWISEPDPTRVGLLPRSRMGVVSVNTRLNPAASAVAASWGVTSTDHDPTGNPGPAAKTNATPSHQCLLNSPCKSSSKPPLAPTLPRFQATFDGTRGRLAYFLN